MILVLKSCYGCGMPVQYVGFTAVPKAPMCQQCRKLCMKPRYVYLNGYGYALPKYDINTPMILDRLKRKKSVVVPTEFMIKVGGTHA